VKWEENSQLEKLKKDTVFSVYFYEDRIVPIDETLNNRVYYGWETAKELTQLIEKETS
jgi:hypothetical protein